MGPEGPSQAQGQMVSSELAAETAVARSSSAMLKPVEDIEAETTSLTHFL